MPSKIHQAKGSDGKDYTIVERWSPISNGFSTPESKRALSGFTINGRAIKQTGEGVFASPDGSVVYKVG